MIAVMVLILLVQYALTKGSVVDVWFKGTADATFFRYYPKIKFEYAGQYQSIPSLGYAQFIEFFVIKPAHS